MRTSRCRYCYRIFNRKTKKIRRPFFLKPCVKPFLFCDKCIMIHDEGFLLNCQMGEHWRKSVNSQYWK